MIRHTAAIAAAAVLVTGCMTEEQKRIGGPGDTITAAEGVKAFSDAVLGHCLPAIHTDQAFSNFEVANVTPLRKLAEGKISMFENDALPVWQMVEGVVQVQLDPGQSCAVHAYGLPVEASFDLIGRTALQTDYSYSDRDVGFPQDGPEYRRILTSGAGDEQVTLELTGTDTSGETPTGEYAKLYAIVKRGS